MHVRHGRHLKILIFELLAIDRLATGAIAPGEVATLTSKAYSISMNSKCTMLVR